MQDEKSGGRPMAANRESSSRQSVFRNPPCTVRDAIILAAGMGIRLRSIIDDRPKGLIEIGGETLVGRSVRLLRAAGISQITIVVGHAAQQYEKFARGQPDIRLVANEQFASTGSMASLAVGLRAVPRDVLVVESDLLFEPRALGAILCASAADGTVVSGPTGAGDEVWVCAPEGRLQALSKNTQDLAAVTGEFVGLTRLSGRARQAMLQGFHEFVKTHGHARMEYETGALAAIARSVPVAAHLISDLSWGEIDDEYQFERVTTRIWPALCADRIQPA
jgi:2-aminoethylphosphonate-pyruvate transaminase